MDSFGSAVLKREKQIERDKNAYSSMRKQIDSCACYILTVEGKLSGNTHQTTSMGVKSFTPDSDYGISNEVYGIELSRETLESLLVDLKKHKASIIQELRALEAKYA